MSTYVHVYPVYEMYLAFGKDSTSEKPVVNTRCRIFDLTSLNAALCTISASMWGRLRPTSFWVSPICAVTKDRSFMYRMNARLDQDVMLCVKATLEAFDELNIRHYPEDRQMQSRYNQIVNWSHQGYRINSVVVNELLGGWYADRDDRSLFLTTAR